jgi:hypothetical protein
MSKTRSAVEWLHEIGLRIDKVPTNFIAHRQAIFGLLASCARSAQMAPRLRSTVMLQVSSGSSFLALAKNRSVTVAAR